MIRIKLDNLVDLLAKDWGAVPGSEQGKVARDFCRREILDNLDRYHNTLVVEVEF